jgi:sec-independent protein translocase protein TatA
MFGPLGFPELVFILVLALLIFGPKRLPEIGRTIGRGMAEFRKASTELKRTINTELALDEPVAPPVRPWSEPAVAPVVPANTAPRSPQPGWSQATEPPIETALEPDIATAELTEPDDLPQPEFQPESEPAIPASANEPLEPS